MAIAFALWGCGGPSQQASVASAQPPGSLAQTGSRHETPRSAEGAHGGASGAARDSSAVPAEQASMAEAGPLRFGRVSLSREEAEAWRREIALASDAPTKPAPDAATRPRYSAFRSLQTIPVGRSHLMFADISSDGSWVVTASAGDGVVRQYDALSGKLLAKLAAPEFEAYGRGSFALWPFAENQPLVLEVDERGHKLLDLRSGSVTQFDYDSGWAMRTSESGRFLGSAIASIPAQTSTLRFARPTRAPALEPLLHLALAERADDWVLSRDERYLTLLFYPSNELERVDLLEGRVVRVLPVPEYAASIDVDPSERYLAVGGAALWVYDLASGQRVSEDKRFDNNIGHVEFSPGGDVLIATAYDGRARSFAITDGKLGERQVLAHRGSANVYAAEFSADGRRLVTSSGDQTLKLWQRD